MWTLIVRTGSDPAALSAAVRRAILAEDSEQPVAGRSSDGGCSPRLGAAATVVDVAAGRICRVGAAAGGHRHLRTDVVHGEPPDARNRIAHGPGRGPSRRDADGGGRGALGSVCLACFWAFRQLAIGRLLKSLLFGVVGSDPATFLAVPVVLLAIAGVASYIPARRATSVDPMIALRHE